MKKKNISRQTIYNRIERGTLETVKEGNKIYIVKEFKSSTKSFNKNSDKFDFNHLENFLKKILEPYEILKEFDYSFLKSRLSSIEKALIDFKIDGSKGNELLNQKIQLFMQEITEKIENMEKKISQLPDQIEKLFSGYEMSFSEKLSLINEKNIEITENIENLSNKIDEITKKMENSKKSLNPFKK